MDFDENDKQSPGGHAPSENTSNEDSRADNRMTDIEKRLNALERQMVHMLSLLEMLIEHSMDLKSVTGEDNDDFGL